MYHKDIFREHEDNEAREFRQEELDRRYREFFQSEMESRFAEAIERLEEGPKKPDDDSTPCPMPQDHCNKCGSISGCYLVICDDCMTRFNRMEAAIAAFCEKVKHAHRAWLDQPYIRDLFEIADGKGGDS